MKRAILAGFIGAGFLTAVSGWLGSNEPAYANRNLRAGGESELITLDAPLDENRQQLTIIDPKSRVVAIYHVRRDSGEIALKSVRNFHWDLQMLEFNGVSPLPREIRALLE